MTVRQTGGIGVHGRKLNVPSPVGTWNPNLDTYPVDFNRDEFTRVLTNKGYDICWEKAAFCPNRKTEPFPRAHDINCTVCDRGWVFYGATSTRMLVTSVSLRESYLAYGRWDMGQVMVTSLPEQRIHYWDRLTLQNGVARFHELVRRQAVTTDSFKYTPIEVEYLAWLNRAGTLVTYTCGDDFQINTDGELEWLITTGLPDTGTYYTVSYLYRPRYIVLDLMHQHRDSTIAEEHFEFPVQAVAKLEFLVRDESKDEAETVDQDPFRVL